MKNNFIINIFTLFYAYIYYLVSIFIIKDTNKSVIDAYSIVLLSLYFFLFLGFVISKIIFNFKIEHSHLKKINLKSFKKINIKNSIRICIIVLFIFFCFFYCISYFIPYKLIDFIPVSIGIKNSIVFIIKIMFTSLPLYIFEITYFEYCIFLQTINNPIVIKIIKFLIYILSGLIFIKLFNITGFLYSKIAIDIFFSGYYIIKLRDIIKLCN